MHPPPQKLFFKLYPGLKDIPMLSVICELGLCIFHIIERIFWIKTNVKYQRCWQTRVKGTVLRELHCNLYI